MMQADSGIRRKDYQLWGQASSWDRTIAGFSQTMNLPAPEPQDIRLM